MKNLSRFYFALATILVLVISFWFYRSSLNYFFFQDDFLELSLSKAGSFGDFLSQFNFQQDRSSYRPIGLQTYFWFSSLLFGPNASGFRVITLGFFFASYLLIMIIAAKITENKKVGFFAASLWVLSSIHFMAITWTAAAWNIIGTFFFLLASLFFLKFLESHRSLFYILTLATFLVALATFEFAIAWPVIFGFYYFYVLGKSIHKSFKVFLPFLSIIVFYLVVRLSLASLPQIPEYQLAFNLESVKAFFWYTLWSFNIPEEFKKQIVTNILVFNPIFLSEFSPLVLKSFSLLILTIFLGLIIPIVRIIRRQSRISWSFIVFCLLWFVAGISPVLVLPNHTFAMYLTLPSIGLYLLLAYLTVNFGFKKSTFAILIFWIAASYTTLSFYKISSWMIESQRFAGDFNSSLKSHFPKLPPQAVIFFELADRRYQQALLDQHALRAIYDDPTLTIYYNKEAFLSAVKAQGFNRPVYIYSAL